MLQDLCNVGAHQLRDMWYLSLDVLFVCAEESGKLHVAVVDGQLHSFADERFDERDHRRFAQVIRSGFETKTEHANAFASRFQDHLKSALDLPAVALQDG